MTDHAVLRIKGLLGVLTGGTGVAISVTVSQLEIWLRIIVLLASLIIGIMTIRSMYRQEKRITAEWESKNNQKHP